LRINKKKIENNTHSPHRFPGGERYIAELQATQISIFLLECCNFVENRAKSESRSKLKMNIFTMPYVENYSIGHINVALPLCEWNLTATSHQVKLFASLYLF